MQSVILNVGWTRNPAQRYVFTSVEDAVVSAHVICGKLGAAPEGLDWKKRLESGEIVNTTDFTLQIEKADFHSDAMLVSDPLPEPIDNSPVDPVFKYVLMREDVPQPLVGRHAAQSNHAGTAFVIRAYRQNNPTLMAMIDEWEKEGDGFGTTIVKTVTAGEMEQAVSLARLMGVYADIVHDPEYFIKDGSKTHFIPVTTCAFVFGRRSDCDPIVRRFPLLKGKGE